VGRAAEVGHADVVSWAVVLSRAVVEVEDLVTLGRDARRGVAPAAVTAPAAAGAGVLVPVGTGVRVLLAGE